MAGALLGLFSLTGVTEALMKIIPKSVKLGIIAGMGLLVALVGMTSVNIVVADPHTIVGLGNMDSYVVYLCILGLCFIGTLIYHQVQGGIVIGITVLAIIGWYITDSFPNSIVSAPILTMGPLDFIDFSSLGSLFLSLFFSFLFPFFYSFIQH